VPHKLTTAPDVRDLLRLSPRRVRALLQRLQEETDASGDRDRRRSPRIQYSDVSILVVRLRDEPGQRDIYYAMVPRNISSGGVALLHGQFVYPRTSCVIHIPTFDGRIVTVRGSTVHCRMVEGRVHELGVAFAEPVDIAEILGHDGSAEEG
jgi:hypothetical protein